MKENELIYSVLAICVTVLLVGLGHFNAKKEEKRIDLFVECLYSNQGLFNDPVEKCRLEVPKIIKWEAEMDDEPEDLMDGGIDVGA